MQKGSASPCCNYTAGRAPLRSIQTQLGKAQNPARSSLLPPKDPADDGIHRCRSASVRFVVHAIAFAEFAMPAQSRHGPIVLYASVEAIGANGHLHTSDWYIVPCAQKPASRFSPHLGVTHLIAVRGQSGGTCSLHIFSSQIFEKRPTRIASGEGGGNLFGATDSSAGITSARACSSGGCKGTFLFRPTAHFSDRAQLFRRELRGAGFPAHARKLCNGKFLHIISIPHGRTCKHVIPASLYTRYSSRRDLRRLFRSNAIVVRDVMDGTPLAGRARGDGYDGAM